MYLLNIKNIINTINLNTFEYNSSMYNASHNISVDPGFTFDNFLHKYKYTKYIFQWQTNVL